VAMPAIGFAPPTDAGSTHGIGVLDLRTRRFSVIEASRHVTPFGAVVDQTVWSGQRLLWAASATGGTMVGAWLPGTGETAVTVIPRHDVRILGAAR